MMSQIAMTQVEIENANPTPISEPNAIPILAVKSVKATQQAKITVARRDLPCPYHNGKRDPVIKPKIILMDNALATGMPESHFAP